MDFQTQPVAPEMETALTTPLEARIRYGTKSFKRKIKGAIHSVSGYVYSWIKVFSAFALFWVKKKVEDEK